MFFDRPLGSKTLTTITMVSTLFSVFGMQRLAAQGDSSPSATSASSMVGVSNPTPGLPVPGAMPYNVDLRCQSVGLGSTCPRASSAGSMVPIGTKIEHQYPRVEGNSTGPSTFSTSPGRAVSIDPDGQYVRKGARQQTGGMRSRTLLLESEKLFTWAEQHVLSITADHILGVDNFWQDWLSREKIDPKKWQLLPSLFQEAFLSGCQSSTCLPVPPMPSFPDS